MIPPPITPGEWYVPQQSSTERRLLVAQNGGRVIGRFDEGFTTHKGENSESERMANQRAFCQMPQIMQALHDLLHAKQGPELYQARADAREALILAGWKEE